MQYLIDKPKRSYNLQLLRFIAALAVIIGHAYSISTGGTLPDPISKLTRDQISLGGVAVAVFFSASGYLIAKSVSKNVTAKNYFKSRIIRIFPPLIFVVLISMFVIGPIFTNLPLKEYFTNLQVYKYFLNSLLLPVHDLPGVFTNNVFVQTVNGALWTLPVEFICYVLCFIMYKMKMIEKKGYLISIPLVTAGSIAVLYLTSVMGLGLLSSIIRPALMFYVGIGLYVFRDRVALDIRLFIISCIIIIISNYFNVLNIALVILFPYVFIYICFAIPQIHKAFAHCGDWSYGMYLVGFPIQQMIVSCYGGLMSPYINMLITIPIDIFCGIMIYNFIEKKINAIIR